MSQLRVLYPKVIDTLEEILQQYDLEMERAHLCAKLFAKASLDGVASHGLNRFPSFIKLIQQGYIDVEATPERILNIGNFERWDGNLGPGNLNAHFCMNQAIKLAKKHGMGCVALRNTNHWMRGGNYGWQAVEEGCIGLCFTNTKPNMPAWGSDESRLGNNPVVIAIPREKGPVVLDMAMTQFSYGKMQSYNRQDKDLPFEGGFDDKGRLTRHPRQILNSELPLPIGLWKGAGLSLMMDIVASTLSDGRATHQIGKQEEEYAISQFFFCMYPPKLDVFMANVDDIIQDLKNSSIMRGQEVRYPGEGTLNRRRQNLAQGVPVDEEIWQEIIDL